jgi:hypothetical protein
MKTNGTPPDEPPLAAALRACADGLYPAEAAAELLISHASWLCRDFINLLKPRAYRM